MSEQSSEQRRWTFIGAGTYAGTGRWPSWTSIVLYAAFLALTQVVWHVPSGVPLTPEFALLSAVGGIIAAAILGVLIKNLPLKWVTLFVFVWSSLFVVEVFADLVEGAFFTTEITSLSDFVNRTLIGSAVTLTQSLAGILLFKATDCHVSLSSALATRDLSYWIVRLLVGSAAYFPIYFLFGGLVSPLVLSYYQNSSFGLALPVFPAIVSIELLRGFLFAVTLLPMIAIVRLSNRSTFLLFSLFLYVVGAFIPFVAGTTLPWNLKLIQSLEIFADSVTFALALTILFKGRPMAGAVNGESPNLSPVSGGIQIRRIRSIKQGYH